MTRVLLLACLCVLGVLRSAVAEESVSFRQVRAFALGPLLPLPWSW